MGTGWGSFQDHEFRKAVVVGTGDTDGKWGSDFWGLEASVLEALLCGLAEVGWEVRGRALSPS